MVSVCCKEMFPGISLLIGYLTPVVSSEIIHVQAALHTLSRLMFHLFICVCVYSTIIIETKKAHKFERSRGGGVGEGEGGRKRYNYISICKNCHKSKLLGSSSHSHSLKLLLLLLSPWARTQPCTC